MNKYIIKKVMPRPSVLFAKEYFKNKKIKVIEIGTYEGKNALSILKNLNIDKLWAIDPYKKYNEDLPLDKAKVIAYSKLNKFDNCILIYKDSNESVDLFKDNSIDFIYIDGNHSYQSVKEDLNNYFNKLNNGGIIAGHDIDWEGVFKAVGEFSLNNNLKLYLKYPDWWIIK